MNALSIRRAVLGGFDWGGRAACIVAALWPERCQGLVSAAGYNIQNIAAATQPVVPEDEHRLWYQYYFHGERGRLGLREHRHDFCHLLWRLWSPSWEFDQSTYNRTAGSFQNPDFVDVVIHSYRHRFGLVDGEPAVREIEVEVAKLPRITVPTIALHGGDDGVIPARSSEEHARFFGNIYHREVLSGVGHNVPQEAPQKFAEALLSLR